MRLLRMLSGLLAGLWVRRAAARGPQGTPDEIWDMERRVDEMRETNLRLIRERRELQRQLAERPAHPYLRLIRERWELQRQLAERPAHPGHADDRDGRARETLDSVRAMLRDQFGWSVKRSAVPHAVAEISHELAALKKRLGEEALREEGLLHSPGTPGSDEATYGCGLDRC